MYDPASRLQLQERIDYEAWIIDRSLSELQAERGINAPLTIEFFDAGAHTVRQQFVAGMGSLYTSKIIHDLVPLMLTAGFKIIDMVIEWCLNENGQRPRGPFFSFKNKIELCQAGRIATWPDFLATDTHLAKVIVGSYVTVRPKRNAIIHGTWGKLVKDNLEFHYTDTETSLLDIDILSESAVFAFCEFSSFLFDRLSDPSRQSVDDAATLRRLGNGFPQLHGQPVVSAPNPEFFRIIFETKANVIDIDLIVTQIKQIRPVVKEIAFDLNIQQTGRKWRIPAKFTASLKGRVALADLSQFQVTS